MDGWLFSALIHFGFNRRYTSGILFLFLDYFWNYATVQRYHYSAGAVFGFWIGMIGMQ
jgi:hypothetical protein